MALKKDCRARIGGALEQSPTAERLAQCFRWLIAGCLLTLPILSCVYEPPSCLFFANGSDKTIRIVERNLDRSSDSVDLKPGISTFRRACQELAEVSITKDSGVQVYSAADLGLPAPSGKPPFWVSTGTGLVRIPRHGGTWEEYLDSVRHPENHRPHGLSLRADLGAGALYPLIFSPAANRDARFRTPIETYGNIGARFAIHRWGLPNLLLSMELIHGEYANGLGKDEAWIENRLVLNLVNHTRELREGLSCFYGIGYGFDWVTIKFGSEVLDTLGGRPEQRRSGDESGPSGIEYGTIKAGIIYELVPDGRGAYVIGRFGLDLPAQQYPSAPFAPPWKILETGLGVGFHW